ncbi:MAG TPA: LLM class flavin-dependent oxidoreductase [bacterium]|nr:LLM class flavin-dependent oxidoreductase [bacterium]
MRLSIIDQSPVPAGLTAADALRNTIELARVADRLGYERYWIAEHHATRAFASSAPEVLMARVAAETSGIRVGSGAVLLPHYSPFKVAETFRVLHALYPDRIDLGIGRAPGGGPLETFALRRDRGREFPDDFPDQLVELLAFLRGGFPADHPFSRIEVTPDMPGVPDIWLLGSSPWSASAAAQLGLPYAFAHFINPQPTRAAIDYYREHVVAVNASAASRTILSLGAVCAETEEEAHRLYASLRLRRLLRQTGDRGPIPTPEDAIARLAGVGDEPSDDDGEWPRYVVGTPEHVHGQLTGIAAELRVEELMILTVVHDHQARLRSYRLLAETFGLAPRATPGTDRARSDR